MANDIAPTSAPAETTALECRSSPRSLPSSPMEDVMDERWTTVPKGKGRKHTSSRPSSPDPPIPSNCTSTGPSPKEQSKKPLDPTRLTLKLKGKVPNEQFLVFGKKVGVTPIMLTNLPSGDLTLKFKSRRDRNRFKELITYCDPSPVIDNRSYAVHLQYYPKKLDVPYPKFLRLPGGALLIFLPNEREAIELAETGMSYKDHFLPVTYTPRQCKACQSLRHPSAECYMDKPPSVRAKKGENMPGPVSANSTRTWTKLTASNRPNPLSIDEETTALPRGKSSEKNTPSHQPLPHLTMADIQQLITTSIMEAIPGIIEATVIAMRSSGLIPLTSIATPASLSNATINTIDSSGPIQVPMIRGTSPKSHNTSVLCSVPLQTDLPTRRCTQDTSTASITGPATTIPSTKDRTPSPKMTLERPARSSSTPTKPNLLRKPTKTIKSRKYPFDDPDPRGVPREVIVSKIKCGCNQPINDKPGWFNHLTSCFRDTGHGIVQCICSESYSHADLGIKSKSEFLWHLKFCPLLKAIAENDQ